MLVGVTDTTAILNEINSVAAAFTPDWGKIAQWASAKLIECGMGGGITSYTFGGRTITKDAQFFKDLLKMAEERKRLIDAPGGVVVSYASFIAEADAASGVQA
jgi:hypothetical protein